MLLIFVLALWNFIITVLCYRLLRKRRTLYDERFAMTLTMTATMISSMVIAMHVAVLLPIDVFFVVALNVSIGITVGCLFGSLVKFHSLLTGLYSGIVGSLMGVMMGEVLKNPELCNIPLASDQQILWNMYQLCGFTTLLLTFVLALVLYSLKV